MLRKILESGALGRRVGNAGLWTFIGFASGNGLRLISNLILTRMLSPEVFGLIALAQVFTNGITMLSDVGVKASVIRSTRGEDLAFLRTAWSIQVFRGVIVMGVCCLMAWPAALLYDQPILFSLICVLALSALIRGFQSISVATANRKLLIKTITLLNIYSQIATLVVTVFAAWQLQSVWALAIGAVVGTTLTVALSHRFLPSFEHRFTLEPEALREIIGFGKWILLATFFTFLGGRGQQAVYGFLFPIEVIGLIAISTLLASVPNDLFRSLLNTILLPSFSEIMRERPKQLPRVLRKVRLFTIGLAFPMFFAVSFMAQPIIELLYDDRYVGAGLILALMALNMAVPTLSATYQNLLLAKGRSDLHALLMFLWATGTVAGIVLGFLTFGLVGSLVGVGLAMSLMFFINIAIAMRRGYATVSLDIVAFFIIVVVYLMTLWTLDIPPSYLSPELVHQIFE
ncbi:MAG: oligosaccharide flippase family protein [Tateyamaria sp.]|uniref:oligosaccharide flippase family protein n=1 Tax=Tateyamaria sp. TaxID=1929288 RepID=UPI003284BCD9